MSEFNVKSFLGIDKNSEFNVKAFLKEGKQIASELYQDYSFDTPQQQEDYKTIVKFWKDKGYNNYAIAKEQSSGGPGRGIAQMEKGAMFDRYNSWLKTSKKEDSLLGQLNYIHGAIEDNLGFNELGSGNAKKLREGLKNVQSVKEATTMMQNIFFKPGKPNSDRRIELSNRAYKELNGNN